MERSAMRERWPGVRPPRITLRSIRATIAYAICYAGAREPGMNAKARPLLIALCAASVASLASAHAQDFYRGRQVRMIIGHPVGGDYDVGGRLLAKYLPRHVPGNPTVIVQNMPQAASLVAANFLYNQAPRTARCWARSRAISRARR